MLIPIRHEGMHARRWPVITFALIAVNVVCFLFTYPIMQSEAPVLGQLKAHILMLAAAHPELTLQPSAQQLVENFKRSQPDAWAQAQKPNRDVEDGWDAKMHLEDDPDKLQQEMDSMTSQYAQMQESSITEQYAFIPAHPKPITYLTANFLHGGWLHLIGNMWFLWLAGFVMEDAWGRPLYAAFYIVAGAAALQLHAWSNPGSIAPTLGASGAVAALMGAFLVRYPKMKIEMLWFIGFIRSYRFKAPAFALLPLWLLMEVFYGALFGGSSGVAHWAHVGGFAVGALAGLAMRYSGLEQKANKGIEEQLTLEADPEIQEASNLIDQGQCEPAIATLSAYIATHPQSVDACNLLLHAYRAIGDQNACAATLQKLCEIHVAAGEHDLAWKSYEDFLNSGGHALPVNTWLDLCRSAEKTECFDRAVAEYEKLAQAHPADRRSLTALLAAGRLCLKQLNEPKRALQFFEAAEKSPVPHLDWEQSIAVGIKEAKAALPKAAAASAGQS